MNRQMNYERATFQLFFFFSYLLPYFRAQMPIIKETQAEMQADKYIHTDKQKIKQGNLNNDENAIITIAPAFIW
jgi:hypothetical protein